MSEEKTVCEICNEYEGTSQQVATHKFHCAKKHSAEPVVKEEPRRERMPFGTPKQKLWSPADDDPRYKTRVFNDNWQKEPGRIQRAELAGYEKVPDWEPARVGINDDGSAIKGIKMRIPIELYEEDQKLKQREVDKVDEAIRRGKLEEGRNDNRYIPQGIKIHSNNNENP